MLTIGQELWYVPSERFDGKARSVTIKKIGRRWAELAGNAGRIDVNTLWMDGKGFSSPGRCWPTRDAWEAENRRQIAWQALRESIQRQWNAPDHLTEDEIVFALNAITGTITKIG